MRRPWRRLALHDRVIVNLKPAGETAIDGVLWDEVDGLLVMRDARMHGAGAAPEGTPIDGEVLIERADVYFAQRIERPTRAAPASG